MKCKNCQVEGKLEEIKDYQYQEEDDSPIETITVLKCLICNCIHWENDDKQFWEYEVGFSQKNDAKAISGWAKSYN